ncbi:ankyrin repeat domain-containing protein [bacterium]|nr:ankyrin repeat domain-containing protein [bacterium]
MNHDDLIVKYFNGIASPEEVRKLEEQLLQKETLQERFIEQAELDGFLYQESHRSVEQAPWPSSPVQKKIDRKILRWSAELISVAALALFVILYMPLSSPKLAIANPSLGDVSIDRSRIDTALWQASATGDKTTVLAEINRGAELDAKNADGLTAMHLAVLYGHREIIDLLISNGASTDHTDPRGNTSLHIAAFLGRWLIVEELLQAGSDARIRNNDGFNPDDLVALSWNPSLERYYRYLEETFHFELDYESIKRARPIIRRTITKTLNRDGPTETELLSQSFANMTGSLLGSTLAKAIPVTPQAKPPSVSLLQATLTGNIGAVQQHIDAGSDLNVKSEFDGSTPLILACCFGRVELVELLLNAGVELEAKNHSDYSALHAAAFFCQVEIIERLLGAGIKTDSVDQNGDTALDMVSSPFSEEIHSVYRHLYGMLRMELDVPSTIKRRQQIRDILVENLQTKPQ